MRPSHKPWMHNALNPKGCVPIAMAAGPRFQWNQYSPPVNWLKELATTLARHSNGDSDSILSNLERHTTGTEQTANTIRAHLKIVYAILTQKVTPEVAGFQMDLTVEAPSTALQIVEGLPNCSGGALERLVVVCDRWESPHSLNGVLGNLRNEIVERVARSRFSAERVGPGMETHRLHYYRVVANEMGLNVSKETTYQYYKDEDRKNTIEKIGEAVKTQYTPLTIMKRIEDVVQEKTAILPREIPDKGVGYDLCLMSDSADPLVQGRIYIGQKNGTLTYSLVALDGKTLKNSETNIRSPENFTLEALQPLKNEILEVTSKAGHTRSKYEEKLIEHNSTFQDTIKEIFRYLDKNDVSDSDWKKYVLFKTITLKEVPLHSMAVCESVNWPEIRKLIQQTLRDKEIIKPAKKSGADETFWPSLDDFWTSTPQKEALRYWLTMASDQDIRALYDTQDGVEEKLHWLACVTHIDGGREKLINAIGKERFLEDEKRSLAIHPNNLYSEDERLDWIHLQFSSLFSTDNPAIKMRITNMLKQVIDIDIEMISSSFQHADPIMKRKMALELGTLLKMNERMLNKEAFSLMAQLFEGVASHQETWDALVKNIGQKFIDNHFFELIPRLKNTLTKDKLSRLITPEILKRNCIGKMETYLENLNDESVSRDWHKIQERSKNQEEAIFSLCRVLRVLPEGEKLGFINENAHLVFNIVRDRDALQQIFTALDDKSQEVLLSHPMISVLLDHVFSKMTTQNIFNFVFQRSEGEEPFCQTIKMPARRLQFLEKLKDAAPESPRAVISNFQVLLIAIKSVIPDGPKNSEDTKKLIELFGGIKEIIAKIKEYNPTKDPIPDLNTLIKVLRELPDNCESALIDQLGGISTIMTNHFARGVTYNNFSLLRDFLEVLSIDAQTSVLDELKKLDKLDLTKQVNTASLSSKFIIQLIGVIPETLKETFLNENLSGLVSLLSTMETDEIVALMQRLPEQMKNALFTQDNKTWWQHLFSDIDNIRALLPLLPIELIKESESPIAHGILDAIRTKKITMTKILDLLMDRQPKPSVLDILRASTSPTPFMQLMAENPSEWLKLLERLSPEELNSLFNDDSDNSFQYLRDITKSMVNSKQQDIHTLVNLIVALPSGEFLQNLHIDKRLFTDAAQLVTLLSSPKKEWFLNTVLQNDVAFIAERVRETPSQLTALLRVLPPELQTELAKAIYKDFAVWFKENKLSAIPCNDLAEVLKLLTEKSDQTGLLIRCGGISFISQQAYQLKDWLSVINALNFEVAFDKTQTKRLIDTPEKLSYVLNELPRKYFPQLMKTLDPTVSFPDAKHLIRVLNEIENPPTRYALILSLGDHGKNLINGAELASKSQLLQLLSVNLEKVILHAGGYARVFKNDYEFNEALGFLGEIKKTSLLEKYLGEKEKKEKKEIPSGRPASPIDIYSFVAMLHDLPNDMDKNKRINAYGVEKLAGLVTTADHLVAMLEAFPNDRAYQLQLYQSNEPLLPGNIYLYQDQETRELGYAVLSPDGKETYHDVLSDCEEFFDPESDTLTQEKLDAMQANKSSILEIISENNHIITPNKAALVEAIGIEKISDFIVGREDSEESAKDPKLTINILKDILKFLPPAEKSVLIARLETLNKLLELCNTDPSLLPFVFSDASATMQCRLLESVPNTTRIFPILILQASLSNSPNEELRDLVTIRTEKPIRKKEGESPELLFAKIFTTEGPASTKAINNFMKKSTGDGDDALAAKFLIEKCKQMVNQTASSGKAFVLKDPQRMNALEQMAKTLAENPKAISIIQAIAATPRPQSIFDKAKLLLKGKKSEGPVLDKTTDLKPGK